jgi:cellulose synthase/poly-beta-1,6-N-acetylglucosamine synthase-like glycosyltransferase
MEGEDRMAQLLPGIHDGDVLVVMDCDKVLDPAQVGEMLRSIRKEPT